MIIQKNNDEDFLIKIQTVDPKLYVCDFPVSKPHVASIRARNQELETLECTLN